MNGWAGASARLTNQAVVQELVSNRRLKRSGRTTLWRGPLGSLGDLTPTEYAASWLRLPGGLTLYLEQNRGTGHHG
jgi:hypothetical protein